MDDREFKKDQGIDLSNDRQALQRLREAAEKAKIELSSMKETEINLPYITADSSGPKHLQLKLTRSKFEQITEDLVQRCRSPFEQALRDASFKMGELDEVILVGGSTRMPMIQDLVRSLTGKEPNKTVNPDEVVSVGAAIQAGVLGRRSQRRAPARCDTPEFGRRDPGWRDDRHDSPQHHGSHPQDRSLQHGR